MSISEAELRAEIASIRASGETAVSLMSDMAGQLNDNGKEIVMRAAYSVAVADGSFEDSELGLLIEIGQAMGLTRAHLTGILQEFQSPPLAAAG